MMKEKYESLPLATLKDLAKARGLKGISTMKKAELIELFHFRFSPFCIKVVVLLGISP